tara:strand:- start:749 stop:1870 length:1122 start_codon:yes stop_codon:yes gene_type:complete
MRLIAPPLLITKDSLQSIFCLDNQDYLDRQTEPPYISLVFLAMNDSLPMADDHRPSILPDLHTCLAALDWLSNTSQDNEIPQTIVAIKTLVFGLIQQGRPLGQSPLSSLFRSPTFNSLPPDERDMLLDQLAKHSEIRKYKDDMGRSALHVAAQYGAADFVTQLLIHGVDCNAQDHGYETALHVAAKNNHVNVIHALRHANLNHLNGHGQSPLHVAVKYNHHPSITALIDCGADINISGPYDMRPIHYAAQHWRYNAIQLLLSKGADSNLTDTYGRNVLHVAAQYGCVGIVTLLMREYPHLNRENLIGVTPLQLAQERDHHQVISVLQSFEISGHPNPSPRLEPRAPLSPDMPHAADLSPPIATTSTRCRCHIL